MRTTISINDALMETVRHYASSRGMKLSRALEELVKLGLEPRPVRFRQSKSGWYMFDVPPDAPPITLKQLLAAEDEEG